MFRVTVITDGDDFLALQGEWNALALRSGVQNLFMSWQWMYSYYTKVYPEEELLIMAVHDGGERLVGLAPFIVRRGRHLFARRVIELIGQRHSYNLQVLAEASHREEVYGVIWSWIFANRRLWDSVVLLHLIDDQAGAYVRRCGEERRCYATTDVQDPSSVVVLDGTYGEYLARLEKRVAKRLQYYRRSLERDYEMEMLLARDYESMVTYWDAFLQLHRRRVANKGKDSVLSDVVFERFYRGIAEDALRDRRLRLVALRLSGEIAAVLFGVVYERGFYFLNIGYREYSKYSLGLVLPSMCIEMAVNEGLRTFDFLGGGGDYKAKLGGMHTGGGCVRIHGPIVRLECTIRAFGRRVWKIATSR